MVNKYLLKNKEEFMKYDKNRFKTDSDGNRQRRWDSVKENKNPDKYTGNNKMNTKEDILEPQGVCTKFEIGEATDVHPLQVGCGNNWNYGKPCKSDWSCDGKCAIKSVDCRVDTHCSRFSDHNVHCCRNKCTRKEEIGDNVWYCPHETEEREDGKLSGNAIQTGCGNNSTSGAHKCKNRWSCNGKCATEGVHCVGDGDCSGHNDDCCNGLCTRKVNIGNAWYCPHETEEREDGQLSGNHIQTGCGNNSTSGAHKCKNRWSCNGKMCNRRCSLRR